jgi:hypothetical protein
MGVFLCFLGFVREETMKSGFSGWFCVQGETMIARALRNRERDGKLWYNMHHFYFIASFFFFHPFSLSFGCHRITFYLPYISNNFVDL